MTFPFSDLFWSNILTFNDSAIVGVAFEQLSSAPSNAWGAWVLGARCSTLDAQCLFSVFASTPL
jgi:hypothetical protein